MKTKKLLLFVLLFSAILLAFTSLSAVARYPRFYVCLTNNTSNTIHYAAQWCTRAGYDCTGYRNYAIRPGATMRHWGPRGNGRMNVTMHSGGPGGVYRHYRLYGTTRGCRGSSRYRIRYNYRGFLRIY